MLRVRPPVREALSLDEREVVEVVGVGSGFSEVDCSSDVVIGAFEPPAWSKTTFTGPTPYTHQVNRMPLPYGSPIAPACVICVRIFAAITPCGNAGTVTGSLPRYVDALETSFCEPPEPPHEMPFSSGSASTGFREPQMML